MNTELFVKWLKIQYWNMLHEIRAHFGFIITIIIIIIIIIIINIIIIISYRIFFIGAPK